MEDLRAHFVQRWNYIFNEKYDVIKDDRYKPLSLTPRDVPDGYYEADGKGAGRAQAESGGSGENLAQRIRHFHPLGGETERGSDQDKVYVTTRDNGMSIVMVT